MTTRFFKSSVSVHGLIRKNIAIMIEDYLTMGYCVELYIQKNVI